MHFKDYLKLQKSLTDKALARRLKQLVIESQEISSSYGMFSQQIKDLILRGGKRLRPLIVRLAYELTTDESPDFDLVDVSLYVELMHLFILVHDDIADRDLKRYGGPTLEVAYATDFKDKFGFENDHFGKSLAMIAGDLIHVLANGALIYTKLDTDKRLAIQAQMQHILHQVIAGWYIHQWQNYMPLNQASKKEYLKGMELVSASYTIQGPLEMGLILSGKQKEYSKILNQIGYHIGMAFQIQDDILGVFGDSQKTGKPVGNDIREGKKTLLVLDAYEKAGGKDKQLLEEALGNMQIKPGTIHQVQMIFESTGALDKSKKAASQHIQKAQKLIDSLEHVNPAPKQRIAELAEFVANRSL